MFEALLTNSQNSIKEYPNSGPGPKTLAAGNEDIGYFGEVPSSLLITPAALKTHLGVGGTVQADYGWLKFMHKGEVKYLSKRNVFSALTWNGLYAAGGMYGTNDNGPITGPTPVNQYKPITIQDGAVTCVFAPRAINGAPQNPTAATSVAITDYNSEYSDLLYRVKTGTHVNAAMFAAFTGVELGMNFVQAMMNTISPQTANYLLRGYPATTNGTVNAGGLSVQKTDASGYNQQWRMVLALKSPL